HATSCSSSSPASPARSCPPSGHGPPPDPCGACRSYRQLLDHGHRFDLDEGARNGEAGDLDQRAGRGGGAEELLPHLAVAFPKSEVRDEHGALHDVPHTGPARLEDATHVLEDAAGLRADVVGPDELTVFVEGELPGDVDSIPDSPAVRVVRTRVGHVRWLDCRTCHYVSPPKSAGQCERQSARGATVVRAVTLVNSEDSSHYERPCCRRH